MKKTIEDNGDKEIKSEKKLTAKALPTPPEMGRYNPPTHFQIEKSKVRGLDIGHQIAVTIRGEVVAIRKQLGESDGMVEVELSNPKVAEVESNQADVEYKRMIEQK